MKRNILLFDQKDSPWVSFLAEYFEDTASQLHFFSDPARAGAFLDAHPMDLVFLNATYLSLPLAQKIKVLRQSRPHSRLFHLGPAVKGVDHLSYDDIFSEPQSMAHFQKQLLPHLVMPEKIRILLIDDEQEIATLMRDYFENRGQPTFLLTHAENGAKGLEVLKKEKFDVIVLDIKMPVLDGRATYRELKSRKITTPVIIFFDAIFGDEMVEIHKYGRPAVVDKGSASSAMPEMSSLIKKMVYFG